jgi:hypothetical protein
VVVEMKPSYHQKTTVPPRQIAIMNINYSISYPISLIKAKKTLYLFDKLSGGRNPISTYGGEMKQEGEERLTTLSEDSEKIRSRILPVRNSYDL